MCICVCQPILGCPSRYDRQEIAKMIKSCAFFYHIYSGFATKKKKKSSQVVLSHTSAQANIYFTSCVIARNNITYHLMHTHVFVSPKHIHSTPLICPSWALSGWFFFFFNQRMYVCTTFLFFPLRHCMRIVSVSGAR
jgi:hypothetical protein